ncbi:MAG: hypothetical protein K8F91_14355, partial [Candidatus Obscuribacterales bacterium]|nr:hypothetical protein [Candidatus Obscuribacterales bacterium]
MAGYEKHDGTDQVEGSERAVTTRETAADAVISGGKDDHQGRYLDAKATENQDSLSDMQLKALSPTDASRAELASDRFEIVDSVEPEAGTADGRQLAIRDDYCNRFEFQGKPLPGDGQTLSFKQILEDYQTPFVDAYERSRQTKDRQPGKSKTLEQVVDRL